MKSKLAAIAALCLLSPSNFPVPTFLAWAENNVWTKNGVTIYSQHFRESGTSGVGASEEGNELVIQEIPTRERRSTALRSVAQWSASSVSRTRFNIGVKLLLAVSVTSVVFLLLPVAVVFRKCLGEGGDLRPVSTLDELPKDNVCQELLQEVSRSGAEEHSGPQNEPPDFSLGFPVGNSGPARTLLVLFAILAVVLAAPLSDSPDSTEDHLEHKPVTPHARDSSGGVDDSLPPVAIQGKKVTIGKGWETKEGIDKQGKTAPISFSWSGKHFEVHLSEATTEVLNHEGLLGQVRGLLSAPPVRRALDYRGKEGFVEDVTWTWGMKGKNAVLLYVEDDMIAEDCYRVGYKMYLPKGAFGVNEKGQTPGVGQAQAWSDLGAQVRAIVHVIETGEAPPPVTVRGWISGISVTKHFDRWRDKNVRDRDGL